MLTLLPLSSKLSNFNLERFIPISELILSVQVNEWRLFQERQFNNVRFPLQRASGEKQRSGQDPTLAGTNEIVPKFKMLLFAVNWGLMRR